MRNNPFRTALLAIGLLGAVVFLVLLLIAGSIGTPYDDPAYVSALRGPVYAWAAGVLGLAITAILLWLHASSISWAAEHPSPSPVAEDASTSAKAAS